MRSSLVIDNFNYAPFLAEAVASACAQTLPFDEIIVVDDGSTDGSAELLTTLCREQPSLRLVSKPNGGQLSAFVAGLRACTGDLVFFLDSDDVLQPTHHESLRRVFSEQREVGMAYSDHETFGAENEVRRDPRGPGSLGLTVIPTLFESRFIGSITSTLAFRRPVLEVLLPVMERLAPQWRTRADDCLVLGASLAGAVKYCSGEVTVRYRLHGTNAFARAGASPTEDYRHFLRRRGYVASVATHLGLDQGILGWADVEYFSAPKRDPELKDCYRRIIRTSRLPLRDKVRKLLKIALR